MSSGATSTSASIGTEQCFVCRRGRTKKSLRCPCRRSLPVWVCEACVDRGLVVCPACNATAGPLDVCTDSGMRSVQSFEEAHTASGSSVPASAGRMMDGPGATRAGGPCAALLSPSSRDDLLDYLHSAITILENTPEAEGSPFRIGPDEPQLSSGGAEAAAAAGASSSSAAVSSTAADARRPDALEDIHQKSLVSALNERLQRMFRPVPGQQLMDWEFGRDSSGGFVATVTINIPECEPIRVRGVCAASSKSKAQELAVRVALPALERLIGSANRTDDRLPPRGAGTRPAEESPASASSPAAAAAERPNNSSGRDLPTLLQEFQRRFRTTPAWEDMEKNPKDEQLFRASLKFPNGSVVHGDWVRGKTEARHSVLMKIMLAPGEHGAGGLEPMDGAEPQVVGAAAAASSSAAVPAERPGGGRAGSLTALQEQFQRRFRASPSWGPIERSSEDAQLFRVQVSAPSGPPAQGDWARGKAEAKVSALRRILAEEVVGALAN